MGNTDSKLQFKTHIFRLFETNNIAKDDSYYWIKFWTQPNSIYEVFTLLSLSDVRKTRDCNLKNLETLILVIFERLRELARHRLFPHNEIAPVKELLNCVRILTRVLPFVYESDNERVKQWEREFFWVGNKETKPIGSELVDIVLDLLFIEGFTITKQTSSTGSSSTTPVNTTTSPSTLPSSPTLVIWESGIGSNTSYSTSNEILSNRVEILRLLLTLTSDCLYENLSDISTNGSNFISYIVTKPDKRLTMTILCSLLNSSLKYSPGGKVPYDHMILADKNRQLVVYSLQLLAVLLVYPIPKTNTGINNYRYFFSKIRHDKDFQFIIDNLLKLISQPILASSSLLPGSHSEINWITELLVIFWELTQCNKKFHDYLLTTKSSIDFVIFLLAYIEEKYNDKSKRELVRLCSYILLYLSSDKEFIKLLQYKVEMIDNSDSLRKTYIMSKSKLSIFNGTYGDYLINQLLPLITNNNDILSPTFLEIIYNLSPYLINISYSTSSNLLQLFTTLLTIESPTKEFSIICLLKIFSNLIHYNFRSNTNLLFVILKNEGKFQYLYNQGKGNKGEITSSSLSKIKGKQPITSSTPRSSSPLTSSPLTSPPLTSPPSPSPPSQGFDQELWVLIDPIITIIENIKQLVPYTEHITNSQPQPQSSKIQPHIIIESIRNMKTLPNVDLDPHEPQTNTFIKFIWNSNSLGWYESIIWGSIFQIESQITSTSGSIGIWNGTNIKLFKLQETARIGPSLLRPKGAVDAVAESVIQQFGKLSTNR